MEPLKAKYARDMHRVFNKTGKNLRCKKFSNNSTLNTNLYPFEGFI